MPDFLRKLFDFIGNYPILLILILGPLLSAVGGLVQRASRKAEEQRQRREKQRSREFGELPVGQEEQPVAYEEPVVYEEEVVVEERPPSPDEIAAEIRRMMEATMGPQAPPPAPPAAAPPPIPAPVSERKAFRPLGGVGDRRLDLHIEPEVGERLAARRGPASGGVGQTALGRLGGRVRRREKRAHMHRDLINTDNLPGAFVTIEVFGPPRALRDWV